MRSASATLEPPNFITTECCVNPAPGVSRVSLTTADARVVVFAVFAVVLLATRTPARDIIIDDAEDREPQPSPAGLLPTHPRAVVVVIAVDTPRTHAMVSFQSISVGSSSRGLARVDRAFVWRAAAWTRLFCFKKCMRLIVLEDVNYRNCGIPRRERTDVDRARWCTPTDCLPAIPRVFPGAFRSL
jgi:hypothetical protein